MAFKFETKELNFEQAEKLLTDFISTVDTFVNSIKNPEGGDCFFVYNYDEKKKGNNDKDFILRFKNFRLKNFLINA